MARPAGEAQHAMEGQRMRRTPRPAITLGATLALLVLLIAPAQAQADYPPTAGEVVDAEVVVDNPEATVEIEGRDWSPDTVVEITYEDADGTQRLGQARVDEDGDLRASVPLPDDADAQGGTFTVAEVGDGGDAQSFTLASTTGPDEDTAAPAGAADDAGGGSALAATGAPGGAMTLGVSLLGAGVLALGAARWWGRRLTSAG